MSKSKEDVLTEKRILLESEPSEFGYREGACDITRSLQVFDPNDESIPEDFFMILSGKRRTGKSFWLRWFLSHERWKTAFEFVYIASNTAFNGFWQDYVGDEFVFNGWSESVDPTQPALGKEMVMKVMEKQVQDRQQGNEKPVLIVLDDCISEKGFHEDEVMKGLAVMGRHFKIAVALTTQHHTGIPPVLRQNMDVGVVFDQHSQLGMKNAYLDYLQASGSINCAEALLARYTKDFGCLVVQNYKNSHDMHEVIKQSRAEEVTELELGGAAQRAINEKSNKESKTKDGTRDNSGIRGSRSDAGYNNRQGSGNDRHTEYSNQLLRKLTSAPGDMDYSDKF